RIGALDADGQDGLLQLALQTLFAAQQEVLRDLLRDGRRAFWAPSGVLNVLDNRASDADEVEPAMLIESLILRREKGVDDELGDGVDRHEDAPFTSKLRDQPSVVRMDARHHWRLVFGEFLVARQVLRVGPQQVSGHCRTRDESDDTRCKQPAKKAQKNALPAFALPLRRDGWWQDRCSHRPYSLRT